jgi:hypothetical protein
MSVDKKVAMAMVMGIQVLAKTISIARVTAMILTAGDFHLVMAVMAVMAEEEGRVWTENGRVGFTEHASNFT